MQSLIHYKDFTLKAKLSNPVAMERTLLESGAKFLGADHQKDTYFKTGKGKLKVREGTIENLITHYERTTEGGIEKTTVFRYDLNPSPDTIKKCMGA